MPAKTTAAQKKRAESNIIAFGNATADPATQEKFAINDRRFYRQEFTAAEEGTYLRDAEQGREDAQADGRLWLTGDEVALLASYLNRRVADGGAPVEGRWVAEALTAKDYRGLLGLLSPNIARLYDAIGRGVDEGKL